MFNLNPLQLRATPLGKLIRTFSKDEVIFKQGEPGKSMFLVVEGVVRIFSNKLGSDNLVGIVRAGEMIGERGILDENPYRRNFTAQGATPVILIEVDNKTLQTILQAFPDFHMRVLRMVLDRLNKANRLTVLLQQPDPLDRLVDYLIYFQEELCKGLPAGLEIGNTVRDIQCGANLDKDFVEDCLNELLTKNIVTKIDKIFYLKDKNRLNEYIPNLRGKFAA